MGDAVQIDATYGHAWDPDHRALVGPLTDEEARRRHGTEEPYVVLLGDPEQPRALLEPASPKPGDLTAWCFDEHQRRTFLFEFRAIFERMSLLRMAEWQYPDAHRPEFDRKAPRCLTNFGRDGRPTASPFDAEPGTEFRGLNPWSWSSSFELPEFGEWTRLAAFILDDRQLLDQQDDDWLDDRPEPGSGPLRPGPEIETMFEPGARYLLEPVGSGPLDEVDVEIRRLGPLRMSTGRIIVCDPGYLPGQQTPFNVSLPPGHHDVVVALARFVENPEHVRVAGCRVGVRDAQVATWEPAVPIGSDVDELGDGEFFASGVDGGRLCVFDAAALPGEVFHDVIDTSDYTDEMDDWTTGLNLIAFQSGWGDGAYPAWVGRDAGGDVVCFVVDTQVLDNATLLGPSATPDPADPAI
ncbi:DUF4241 domain-containing protein [Pseudonocardia sp. TRM90224]|uniref:DUF4241 domain-containing protein n=1 Tax=Pseudonocardia sp. TRM90224 TaxID=2812678 RepID=UPI001E318DE7|nr:DUF4241 domain-containing protein [Pseudonocardia sp. TRM90224]